jgi:formylglycine-generating enzyme required for sulfatase activity
MAGNVYEWLQDWYHDSYKGAPTDGSAWQSPAGSCRVVRGGSWNYLPGYLRAAYRFNVSFPTFRYDYFGIRLARSLP